MTNCVSGWRFALPLIAELSPLRVSWPPPREENWQLAIKRNQLRLLAALHEDWDRSGGAAIAREALAQAKRLLDELALYRREPTFISPSSAGTVIFIWEGPHGEGHLEIGNKNFGFYTAPIIGDPIMESGDIGDLDGEQLNFLLAGVLASGIPHSVVDTHVIGRDSPLSASGSP